MDAKKPEGAAPAAEAPKKKKLRKRLNLLNKKLQNLLLQLPATYATGAPSPAAKKILDEKGIDAATGFRYWKRWKNY
jgi:2-oxoglutarate dehydrogenase E2 component (dihydrolipoamide succinyltransferase)